MQTRNELYEAQPFQGTWKTIIDVLDNIDAPIGASPNHIENLARLKKAVTYVNELIKAADRDLIPVSVWQGFTNPCNHIKASISQNENTPSEKYVDSANGQVDLLIQLLSPFVLTGEGAAQAVGRSLLAYSKAIREHTDVLEKKTLETIDNAEAVQTRIDELNTRAEVIESTLLDYQNELLSDSPDATSTKTKIAGLLQEITASREEVISYRNELIGTPEDSDNSIAAIVESNKDAIVAARKAAVTSLATMTEELSDLKTTYTEIMGSENDEGEIEGGLKATYDEYLKLLSDYDKSQKTKHTAIFSEIENLLPAATSAGLASSFATQRGQYENPIRNFGIMFYVAVGLLFLVGVLPLFSFSEAGRFEFGLPSSWSEMLVSTFARVSFTVPLVWLAFFAAKRRNENRRLEEEYAHKETIARSFYSFRQQVEKLGTEDSDKLSAKLLEAAITAVSFNASKSLDKDHDDKLPNLEHLGFGQKSVRPSEK